MPADDSSPASSRFEEAARRVESEVQRLITVFNDEVVPSLRQDGGRAMRKFAQKLHQMADHLDRSSHS